MGYALKLHHAQLAGAKVHLSHSTQSLIPAPCPLHPAPCTLHPTPCTLHPAPCTRHPSLRSLVLSVPLPPLYRRCIVPAVMFQWRYWVLLINAGAGRAPAVAPAPLTHACKNSAGIQYYVIYSKCQWGGASVSLGKSACGQRTGQRRQRVGRAKPGPAPWPPALLRCYP